MELSECIKTRRSVRDYEKKDVPDDLIGQIVGAGILAPSAGNTQPWEFIVVKDKEMKRELAIASLRQRHVNEAPVLIVVCANLKKSEDKYRERGKKLYSIQDTAAAIENMLLTVNDLGLGAVWVGSFEEDKVKTLLNIPETVRPVAIITIGFPIPYKKETKKQRIPFENLTWSEKYGQKFSWIEKRGGEWKLKTEPGLLQKRVEKLKDEITSRDEEKGEQTESEKKSSTKERILKSLKLTK